jgi:hypothetical protein
VKTTGENDRVKTTGPKSRATAAMEKSKAPRVSQADLVKACMFKSPAPLIDIGANLTDRSFENDRMEVVSRADNMNVKSMIVTGETVLIWHLKSASVSLYG